MSAPDDDLMRIDAVREKCGGISERTLRRWMKEFAFPRPTKPGRRLALWKKSQVNTWIDRFSERTMR